LTSVPAFPADLVTSLRAGRVNLFVGSGPSSSARLSNWDDLIQEMAEVIKRENHTFSPDELDIFLAKRNHLDIAEMFRQTVGPHAYFRFLRERYRKDVRPSPLHRAIAKLPAKTIFTTNYDKLLETAFRIGNRIDPAAVIFPEQLNYIEDDEVRIIKLHGDIDHPSTIILTRTDYAGYASKHQEFINLLQSSINGRTMLFLGFGLRDSNFERIYDDARHLYDSTNRQAYAFMAETNAVDPVLESLWLSRGVRVLRVAEADVSEIFDGLRQRPKRQKYRVLEPGSQKILLSKSASDEATASAIIRFLRSLGLDVITVADIPSHGRTLVEKFEHLVDSSVAAVVIIGPQGDPYHIRSGRRENVVFELGYLMGKLGRERVVVIVTKGAELPSDLAGLGYLIIDPHTPNVLEADLRKWARASGLQVTSK
jgi:predicted nucleotide-binding protein